MTIRNVYAVYFSPTGNAGRIATETARTIADKIGASYEALDFTSPLKRGNRLEFEKTDLLVLSLPVYAGRIPNKILPWIQHALKGSDTQAVALCTFGNRNCDSTLAQMRAELKANGFRLIAAAAIVSQHVFTDKLAPGRPNEEDMRNLRDFALKACDVIDRKDEPDLGMRAKVAAYYRPLREDGKPAEFLKARAYTDSDKCTQCGRCAASCPMSSISRDNYSKVVSACIKCHACLINCPAGAKYFEDDDMSSHIKMLEANYQRPAKNEFYL